MPELRVALELRHDVYGRLSPRLKTRVDRAIADAVFRERQENEATEILFFRVPPLKGERVRLLMHSDADTLSRAVVVGPLKRQGGKKR